MPSGIVCHDVRLLHQASHSGKVSTWSDPNSWGRAGGAGTRVGVAAPQRLHPLTVPPSGARPVRGLGLLDRGRLAVTAALSWPFPALKLANLAALEPRDKLELLICCAIVIFPHGGFVFGFSVSELQFQNV